MKNLIKFLEKIFPVVLYACVLLPKLYAANKPISEASTSSPATTVSKPNVGSVNSNNSEDTGVVMFMKRPHINTEAERNAKFDIQELITFERFCRDNEQWEEMRKCFMKDSVVDISWFKGSGDDFVTASKNMNIYAPHKIHNILTYVNGDRAVSIMMATVQIRLPINGILCEVSSDTKLLFKTQKKEGQWYIAGFTSIYDKDSMVPVIPSNKVTFPASALDGLRESYACLAYTGISAGRSINNDLPGRDRPESIKEIYTELENWLYEEER